MTADDSSAGYGVIFDMDGVLVDSYEAHFSSWQHLEATGGLTVEKTTYAAMFGRTAIDTIEHFWGVGRFTPDEIKAIDREKEARYREIVTRDFPAMDGVRELIAALSAAGFRLAVGSSGAAANVELALDQLGQRSLFTDYICGHDVSRGKPDPEVFVKAAERIGLPPVRCAVIEDAPVGIAAANAAGTYSIGFASTGHTRDSLSHARVVIDSLRELTSGRIREWIDGAR